MTGRGSSDKCALGARATAQSGAIDERSVGPPADPVAGLWLFHPIDPGRLARPDDRSAARVAEVC